MSETWFTKSGMYVVYKKWYVGGLRKIRLQAEARN